MLPLLFAFFLSFWGAREGSFLFFLVIYRQSFILKAPSLKFLVFPVNSISLSCLLFGLQRCFQAIWSFPLYNIYLNIAFHCNVEFLRRQAFSPLMNWRCDQRKDFPDVMMVRIYSKPANRPSNYHQNCQTNSFYSI